VSSKLHAGRVDDESRFDFSSRRDRRASHGYRANLVAFPLHRFAAFAANHSREAAAELQIVIRGVDDRINIHLDKVALLQNDFLRQVHGG
jgi:hypothetical protein